MWQNILKRKKKGDENYQKKKSLIMAFKRGKITLKEYNKQLAKLK
jgi:hypothetical protein